MICALSGEKLDQLLIIKPIESLIVKAIIDQCFPLENTLMRTAILNLARKEEALLLR